MARQWIKVFEMEDGEQIAAEIFFDEEKDTETIKYRAQKDFGEVSITISGMNGRDIDALFSSIGSEQAAYTYSKINEITDEL